MLSQTFIQQLFDRKILTPEFIQKLVSEGLVKIQPPRDLRSFPVIIVDQRILEAFRKQQDLLTPLKFSPLLLTDKETVESPAVATVAAHSAAPQVSVAPAGSAAGGRRKKTNWQPADSSLWGFKWPAPGKH